MRPETKHRRSRTGLTQRLAWLLCACLALVALPALAADITALRSWRAPDNTRLVLDLSGPVTYRLSPDSSPARLVIEIDEAQVTGPLALPAVVAPLKGLRLERQGKRQHLVIDTAQELSPKLFQLPPNEKYGHRLVIDLYDKPMLPTVAEAASSSTVSVPAEPVALPAALPPEKPAPKPQPEKAQVEKKDEKPVVKAGEPAVSSPGTPAPEKYDPKRYRNIVVAIDAGHGGEDPGAVGRNGTHEKNVTLAIARELKALLDAEPGLTAVLTRTGDYFIPLPERRRLARYQHKADIFISIHADAAENRAAKGASVFALSLKGAGSATSRFAQMLAERENRSDLIGGVAIEKDDDILRNVLADMVVAGSLEHSLHMGRFILGGLGDIGHLHSKRVEQAGFAVLKEPGMVSLLVETGFISNPDEEKKLIDKDYQLQLARAVFDGVQRYCQQYPSPGTYFAWLAERGRPAVAAAPANTPVAATPARAVAATGFRRHRVERGDNLTRLAAQYQVSMSVLREVNNLRDDNVKVGQVLKIPVP